MYRNQLQLETTDALYSDGKRYEPALAIARYLKRDLAAVKSVLVLGSGLGSIVRVLHDKGHTPRFTLVEYDKIILRWAIEFMDTGLQANLEPVCKDAALFMGSNVRRYDLIFIDIFNGRVVPDFVTTPHFLQLCKSALNPGGRLAFNFMINDNKKWENARAVFLDVFPDNHILELGINRVLIARNAD